MTTWVTRIYVTWFVAVVALAIAAGLQDGAASGFFTAGMLLTITTFFLLAGLVR